MAGEQFNAPLQTLRLAHSLTILRGCQTAGVLPRAGSSWEAQRWRWAALPRAARGT